MADRCREAMMASESVGFDRAADYYDQTRGFPAGQERPIAAMMAEAGGLTPQSRVVEIGIGTGRIALPLSAHVGWIVGVDVARRMMNRLREKRTGERIDLIEGDATQIPLASDTFDAAVVVHVFHLIPGWQAALNELARVLRSDGRLLHGHNWRTADSDPLKPLADVWRSIIPLERERRVGVQEEQYDTFLDEMGWQRTGERRTHRFTITRTPQQFLDSQERRLWSGCWQISEEDHLRAVQAVWEAMRVHYEYPDVELEIPTGFDVDVYLPPG
jgi:ubiquinone/menaquinone biosynthesis C-methylase UbiE